ncbi:MAG TPA: YraN family protein [Thermoanaerobaculia bacterium]|nr:YraN family protein [Thermoanaerobaculia bacterium]
MFSRIRAVIADAVRRVRAVASRRPKAGFAGTRGAGARGEDLAVAALRESGYRILERNFRTPVGEIDVIAEEGDTLCFVEVKWRRGTGTGHPAEAVTVEKQRRIARAAEWYLARRRGPARPCRFDVVAMIAAPDRHAMVDAPDDAANVEIVRDAFRGPFPPRRRR